MHILVTGAAGFIGSHLCERLVEAGHTVTAVDRRAPLPNLAALSHAPRFHYLQRDLRRDWPPSEDYAAVCHLAALAGTLPSWGRFSDYLEDNVLVTQRLLAWACEAEQKPRHLLYVSSSSIYGREATGEEDAAPEPISPYGCTKLAAEFLLRAYGDRYGLAWTILRPFSVYGPRQRPDMFVHILVERLLRGWAVPREGDGEQLRSFTYVLDAVAAITRVLDQREHCRGRAFNVGGGAVCSLNSLIALTGELVGAEPLIEQMPPRPGDQRKTEARTAALARATGWQAEVGLREGLAQQIEWQRQQLRRKEPACALK